MRFFFWLFLEYLRYDIIGSCPRKVLSQSLTVYVPISHTWVDYILSLPLSHTHTERGREDSSCLVAFLDSRTFGADEGGSVDKRGLGTKGTMAPNNKKLIYDQEKGSELPRPK